MRFAILTVYLSYLLIGGVDCCGRGSIHILNNEYRQILISISEQVPEDAELIQAIKDVFTKASAILYSATKNRAYFGDVTILLPMTWSDKPEYELPGKETHDRSDVVVDVPNDGEGDVPFTIHSTPCGQLGSYIHLTPDFLLDTNLESEYGLREMALVHEWGHLRYGVFDEFALDGESQFYAGSNGEYDGVRCTMVLGGNGDVGGCSFDNGLPDSSCPWKDDLDPDLPAVYGSIMYKQFLNHITNFCDNNADEPYTYHNKRAPNEQNLKCNMRSVWEVMRTHGDFAIDNNPPRAVDSTVPVFRVVRQKKKRFVLVLDVSGSMGPPENLIDKLNQGASTFIKSYLKNEEKVGIVKFATYAEKVSSLVSIDDNNRDDLASYLTPSTGGRTSIASGIIAGLELLEEDGFTEGGTIIVVSDGNENVPPYIDDIESQIQDSKTIIHTIAISDEADRKLESIALMTGGLSFFYSLSDTSNAINDAFLEIHETDVDPSKRSYQLSSNAQMLSTGQSISQDIIIDDTLGRDTEFIFDYQKTDGISFTLTSPAGRIYDAQSTQCELSADFFIYRCLFNGIDETGIWSYTVENLFNGEQRVAVSVLSKSKTPGVYPIIAQSFWNSRTTSATSGDPQILFVSVSKGYLALLNANVVATIERPLAAAVTLNLTDSGSGADGTKDDGIYSAYFIGFSTDGRYNVKVQVNSSPASVISGRRIIGKGAASSAGKSGASESPSGDFQRIASAGTFELTDYNFASGKIYPPGKVTDLRVTSIKSKEAQVQIQWTAMGNQLDTGLASRYEIRYSHSFDDLVEDFASQNLVNESMIISDHSTEAPSAAGTVEIFTLQMDETGPNITYFIALKIIDEDGRYSESELSNVASVSMRHYGGSKSGLIIAIIVFLVVCVILIIIAVVLRIKFGGKTKTSGQDQESGAQETKPEAAAPVYENVAYVKDENAKRKVKSIKQNKVADEASSSTKQTKKKRKKTVKKKLDPLVVSLKRRFDNKTSVPPIEAEKTS